MIRMPVHGGTNKKLLKASAIMLGSVVGVFLIFRLCTHLFISSEPERYEQDWIALVYQEASEFRGFLEKNVGKKVIIQSAIALDDATPVNHLVHQVCKFNGPDEAALQDASTPRTFSFGLPEFGSAFEESELESIVHDEKKSAYVIPARVLSQVRCVDSIVVELMKPGNFRWSYGGTGTRSLPLMGTFRVTQRIFSGPRVEYTLRQLEE